MFDNILGKILAVVVTFSLVTSNAAATAETGGRHRVETGSHQQVSGIDIYYGVLPAQIAGKHPVTHKEQTMHGGVPPSKDQYHLVVALFDSSGKRITDAEVSATVGIFGMAGTRKALESMRIGDTASFGNYFPMRKDELYRIAFEIRRLGKQGPETIEALFDYRLQ